MNNGHGCHGNTRDHFTRPRCIEGQVCGLQHMISQGECCIDILTQVSAVQSAPDSAAVNLLKSHMNHCVVTMAHEPDGATQARISGTATTTTRLIRS